MRKLLIPLACAFALAGCATDIPMSTTWQIANVYVSTDTPSQVLEPAYLVFGDSTVTGSTGCAAIQGRVSFKPDAKNPTSVNFRHVNISEPSCDGAQRFFHDHMVSMLSGEFEVKKERDEMLLTKTDGMDRPGIRLVAAK